VALCQARTSTKPLWGLSSSNPYHPSHVPNKYTVQYYQHQSQPVNIFAVILRKH
jgi:hypothetical protein